MNKTELYTLLPMSTMFRYLFKNLLLMSVLFLNIQLGHAQERNKDFHLLGGIVIGADTLPVIYMNDVTVQGKMDPKRRSELNTLRYNVTKVYPYAVTAAYILQKVDDDMNAKKRKKDKKKYVKQVEKEMNDRFKDDLKNLSMTQGKILVKLINRETGRDVYDIIKEVKGGFNARIYQTTAFFFKNNLKTQYDPFNEDKDIEMIVKEIEAKTYLQNQKLPLTGTLAK